jgi:hypothetical protein
VQREVLLDARLAGIEERQRDDRLAAAQQLQASEERIAALEAGRLAAAQQLQASEERIAALETDRLAAAQQLQASEERIAALETASEERIAALEGRLAAAVEASNRKLQASKLQASLSREGLKAAQRALGKKLGALERSSEGLGHSLGLLTQQAAALDERHTEVVVPQLDALHEAERTWAPRLQQLVGSCEQLQNDHLALRGSVDAAAAAAAVQLQRQLGELRSQVAQGEEGREMLGGRLEALGGRLEALGGRQDEGLVGRLEALGGRLDKAEYHLGGLVPWVPQLQAGHEELTARFAQADGCLRQLVPDVQHLMGGGGGGRQQQLGPMALPPPGVPRPMGPPPPGCGAAGPGTGLLMLPGGGGMAHPMGPPPPGCGAGGMAPPNAPPPPAFFQGWGAAPAPVSGSPMMPGGGMPRPMGPPPIVGSQMQGWGPPPPVSGAAVPVTGPPPPDSAQGLRPVPAGAASSAAPPLEGRGVGGQTVSGGVAGGGVATARQQQPAGGGRRRGGNSNGMVLVTPPRGGGSISVRPSDDARRVSEDVDAGRGGGGNGMVLVTPPCGAGATPGAKRSPRPHMSPAS